VRQSGIRWLRLDPTNVTDYGTATIDCPFHIRTNSTLRVSRPGSLRFRIRFVFPVCHLFPVVVSQYLIHVQLIADPSQNRTCAVNASGSPPTLACAKHVADAPESPLVRRCVRELSKSHRVLARMPSLHRSYPASIHSLGLRTSAVICILRTP
jgi:hypothetical protein